MPTMTATAARGIAETPACRRMASTPCQSAASGPPRHVVPNIDETKFVELATAAKDGCPVSQALKGNVDLTVVATLRP